MSSYADTSFLVSLYVLDAHSGRIAAQAQKIRFPIVLNSFGHLELTNAISLRVFRSEITSSKAKATQALVHKDIVDGVILIQPPVATTFERALQIARRRTPQLGTRTLDIVHVASALELKAERFYTLDHNQARLARAEGLLVAGLS